MAGLLKDLYSPSFYKDLTNALAAVVPSFNKQRFVSQIFTGDFIDKELKERMRHTTKVMRAFMPADFAKSVKIIQKLINQLKKEGIEEGGLAHIFLPDYISEYGLDDFDTSVQAIEEITQFVSCEFAVRPFLLVYGKKMIAQMLKWSKHKNDKVRRLSSEGSRPRLPWAMAIPELKSDPSPILPILDNLKNDPSEWVRRSVANSLNDMARDHPELVIGLAAKWRGISPETDAVIKHGSRTLLKRGHAGILSHYGLISTHVHISGFKILTPSVKIGEQLDFCFYLLNQDRKMQTVRLEYGLYYLKANGAWAKKVFKISEKVVAPGARLKIERKQSFKKITTRTFYPGNHKISVIVNGEEKITGNFVLRK
jgi:3-methyladenine DNA glycosylase AlkC